MMLARWESLRGKHWVEFHGEGGGYGYHANDAMGFLAATNGADALAELQAKIDSGYFLPDNAKQPMKRVF